MSVALVLTLLAIGGVAIGVSLGQARIFSDHLAAVGGGLLAAISLFWLTPEIIFESGWLPALAMTAVACLAIAVADSLLVHAGVPFRRLTIGPVLAATATHSFLDGWSVRVLGTLHIAGFAAPLGLALHKIPEGVAVGWIARRCLQSYWGAAAVAAAAEVFTLVGAYVEPRASQSGTAVFGTWWTSAVIAIVSGSFLFLGVHAVLPNRRRLSVLLVFTVTFVVVATAGILKIRAI
jgi:zinc transporter ZupT